jgi:hypothetical protein
MIRALPFFEQGRAILEFQNEGSELVTVTGAVTFPAERIGGPCYPFIGTPLEIPAGKRRRLDVTDSVLAWLDRTSQQEQHVRLHIILSLEPDVNKGVDPGSYLAGYCNGQLTTFESSR